MNTLLDSIANKINFNFVKKSYFAYLLSTIFLLIAIFIYSLNGFNLGVDFSDGQIFEIKSLDGDFNINNIRQDLKNKNLGEASVQHLGNKKEIIIKLKGTKSSSEDIKQIFSGQTVEYIKIDFVGSQMSKELIFKGLLSVFLALLGMFLYLLFRFNWCFAFSGIIALIHDVCFIFSFFILTKIEFNIPSVAAILTIIGYSINDSVVIFDRIREFSKKKKKLSVAEIIDQAIKSTLVRTTLTSITTILAAIPLVFLGKGTLHDFSITILFGVIVGTYSSIFIAGPLISYLPVKK